MTLMMVLRNGQRGEKRPLELDGETKGKRKTSVMEFLEQDLKEK